jgi:hypothetical protein
MSGRWRATDPLRPHPGAEWGANGKGGRDTVGGIADCSAVIGVRSVLNRPGGKSVSVLFSDRTAGRTRAHIRQVRSSLHRRHPASCGPDPGRGLRPPIPALPLAWTDPALPASFFRQPVYNLPSAAFQKGWDLGSVASEPPAFSGTSRESWDSMARVGFSAQAIEWRPDGGCVFLGRRRHSQGSNGSTTGFVACKDLLAGINRSIGRVATAASIGGVVISRRVPGEGDGGEDVATTKLPL